MSALSTLDDLIVAAAFTETSSISGGSIDVSVDLDDFGFATAFGFDVAALEILGGGGGGGTILDGALPDDAAFACVTGTARTSGDTTLEALGTTLEDEEKLGGG